jgi:hypothetical protein
MKKTRILLFTTVLFLTAVITLLGCGEASNTKRILRNDATSGSIAWLELIEKNGVNAEWDGSTLLGEAIKAGRVDIVEALIKDKVDVNRPAFYINMLGQSVGIPPLYLASSTGAFDKYFFEINLSPEESSKIMVSLIKAGANVREDNFDIILLALRNVDRAAFDAALPKYNSGMLDFSSFGMEEFDAGRSPFAMVYNDSRFEEQKPMLQELMNKKIQFGFYDIQKAISLFSNPQLDTYNDDFLFTVLTYMTNQNGFNFLSEEPDNFNEYNPYYINPLDIATASIYFYTSEYNVIPTDPSLYYFLITLFGEKGLMATPYRWGVNHTSSYGTIPIIMNIIARKIQHEIMKINPYGYGYSQAQLNASVCEDWDAEWIIMIFERLSEYGALYNSQEEANINGLNLAYPPDYLFNQIFSAQGFPRSNNIPYGEIFKPYFPVFEWLRENGYLTYGIRQYLEYEGGLSVEEFFAGYNRRIEAKITTPNDRYAQYGITFTAVEEMARRDPVFSSVILPEAREIIARDRIGFSREVKDLLRERGFASNNLLY